MLGKKSVYRKKSGYHGPAELWCLELSHVRPRLKTGLAPEMTMPSGQSRRQHPAWPSDLLSKADHNLQDLEAAAPRFNHRAVSPTFKGGGGAVEGREWVREEL